MKKITAILLAILMLAVLISGCGSSPALSAEKPEEPAAAAEETAAAEPAAEEAPAEEVQEESAEPVTVRIGALKGATTIGMVKLIDDIDNGLTSGRYEFTMAAAADELTPKLLKGELDVLALPVNAAANLYNKSSGGVKIAAINTLGVIYIVEKGGETVTSVADLKGKTIYATGKGNTPEFALRYLLAQYGLDMDSDVTMEWKSEPSEVVATMATMDTAVAMLPQPFVTVASMQLEGLHTALDLTEEWNRLENGSTFITAGLVVRSAFAEENPEALRVFLEEYAASTDFVNASPSEAALIVERLGIVAKAAIAEKAIPYCNIVCITGAEMKSILPGYLQVLYDLKPESVGGAMPGDDFYWIGD